MMPVNISVHPASRYEGRRRLLLEFRHQDVPAFAEGPAYETFPDQDMSEKRLKA
jgi:hypothetical protein